MNELISVIVPCYNIEDYIENCLESLIKQSYRTFEIICIDDGSTDHTYDICKVVSSQDNRIRVFHKTNGGLSDARNFGLSVSSGSLVTFVDGDDYVDPDYLKVLLNLICEDKSDISVCNFYIGKESKQIPFYKHNKRITFSSDKALSSLFYQKLYDVSAWGKLYKKTLFDGILYPKGMLYEDNGTTYKLFLKANKVSYDSKPLYHYVQRSGSIMNSSFKDKKMDGLFLSKLMIEDISNQRNKILNSAKCKHLSVCFDLFIQSNNKEPYSTELFSEIKKYRVDVFFNIHSRFKNKVASFISLFGKKASLHLLKKLKKQ